ncbi:hypothetical protein ACIPW5_05770 [Streptomyces sp. NPDC090077]|uniref:hypothetical protein n=1 Tax=Streptomyces sp. NPDC090077 TaxID=3365938 RepID=UPI0037FC6EF3
MGDSPGLLGLLGRRGGPAARTPTVLACAQRAGYVPEGTHRARTVHHGSRRDAWIAALLPQDLGRAPSVPYPGGPAR